MAGLKPIVLLFFLILTFSSASYAQETAFEGRVQDEKGNPIVGATVSFSGTGTGTVTNGEGRFSLMIKGFGKYEIKIAHVSYIQFVELVEITSEYLFQEFTLLPDERQLDELEISEDRLPIDQIKQNELTISSRSAQQLPSAFGDFSKVLATLPGVISNNELSSSYAVRGGNFDENQVYVNDIPVYRPFLANAGRQEGLSFVNPALVQDVSFFAGGWEAKYGDRLSSNLNIEYKEPESLEGSATVGLLGGSVHIGGASDQKRFKYLIGARHRDSRYLLNSLEVDGQYFPTYTDVQGLLTFDLTKKGSPSVNRTKLNVLMAYGRNRYTTEPESQTTEFGSVVRNLRLQTAFIGQENLDYDTYQIGLRLTHRFSTVFRSNLITSSVFTQERENFEVEGGYRLCDIDNNPTSSQFDQCVVVRGIGTQFDYGRNALEATLNTIEQRNEWLLDNNDVIEFGVGVTHQIIDDRIKEYAFIDSAGFVDITSSINNALSLRNAQFFGFVQYTHFSRDSVHLLNLGLRANYWNESDETLFSPRFQYQIRPRWKLATRFNFSAGLYSQHPFYRELRDRSGNINLAVKAQKSLQLITGMDQFYTFWGRPFVLTTQVYYKSLWDLNPYEIDNVRIRYFADNIATGYAYGVDARLNGEFIKGAQSWLSIGYLRTEENIEGDGRGLIRRPSDQRIKVAVYFEDHMPNDPSLRIYLNLIMSSGFPFGPPGNDDLRNVFTGDEYYRADLGLSKVFKLNDQIFNNFWIRLEVLNAFAADNTISYSWIEDVNGTSFAIPNALTARYFNIKASVDF